MIMSPIPYVKTQNPSYCTQCDSDMVKTYEHAYYPGMKVCESCLDRHGAKDMHVVNLKTDYDAWDAIAKAQGRDIYRPPTR